MFPFSGFLRSHALRYCTVSSIDGAAANQKPQLMVDYLMDSLRFSKEDAISATSKSKITHLRSTINSDSAVNIFKNYGLDISQIREIVSSAPKILNCKPKETLEPKLRVFKELGLSGSGLVNLIRRNPEIFRYGLHTRIMPWLDLIRKLVGSDAEVIEVINRSIWLGVRNYSLKSIASNVSLLQNYGLLNERIVKFVLNKPFTLAVNPELLEGKLPYVEEKLGISRESHNFIYAVSAVLWCTDLEVEKKMQVFRSFGWSDLEIATLVRAQPCCLSRSDADITDKLNFFMKELKFPPTYLMGSTHLWTLSLEKRMKPRYKVLKILKERELVKEKLSFTAVVKYTELKFTSFLQNFESQLPNLCETYKNSVRNTKSE